VDDLKYNIYIIILLASLVVGGIKFNVLNKTNRVFLVLILLTIIAELAGRAVSIKGKSNYIIYHFFTPIQCVLVLLGYYLDLKNKIILYIIPSMLLLGIILSLWIQPLPHVNTYFMNIEILLFTILTIKYFRDLLSLETTIKLKDFSLFWISCGLLIFCIANIFLLGAFNYIIDSKSNGVTNKFIMKILLYIRYFSNYLYYSSFIVAFLVKQNTISEQNDK